MKRILAKLIGIIINLYFFIIQRNKRIHQSPLNNKIDHNSWQKYLLYNFDKPGYRVLEIGSRNVTGSLYGRSFKHAHYTGFDIYNGENVDVIGDAHKLSSYFEKNSFDLVFSSAVFEHLYAPWIVANEINKVLKVGGFIFVETHFSFSLHEEPWNFFQFSHYGLAVLFSEAFGFEVVEKGMSNPINGLFSLKADKYLRNMPIFNLYCHSQVLAQKLQTTNIEFTNLSLVKIVGESSYPNPKMNL